MNAVNVEDLLDLIESMKHVSADEIIAASKENNELERIAHIATEATYKAVIEKLENLKNTLQNRTMVFTSKSTWMIMPLISMAAENGSSG